jgi:hypothetical protein
MTFEYHGRSNKDMRRCLRTDRQENVLVDSSLPYFTRKILGTLISRPSLHIKCHNQTCRHQNLILYRSASQCTVSITCSLLYKLRRHRNIPSSNLPDKLRVRIKQHDMKMLDSMHTLQTLPILEPRIIPLLHPVPKRLPYKPIDLRM